MKTFPQHKVTTTPWPRLFTRLAFNNIYFALSQNPPTIQIQKLRPRIWIGASRPDSCFLPKRTTTLRALVHSISSHLVGVGVQKNPSQEVSFLHIRVSISPIGSLPRCQVFVLFCSFPDFDFTVTRFVGGRRWPSVRGESWVWQSRKCQLTQ